VTRLQRITPAHIVLLSTVVSCVAEGAAPRRPNAILVLSDDQGRGDVWVGGPFKAKAPGTASFEMKKVSLRSPVPVGDTSVVFDNVTLPVGRNGFRVNFEVAGRRVFGGKDADGDNQGPIHVTFERK